jgi:peptidoglycan/LPS O-acetylase OafA/YrhL
LHGLDALRAAALLAGVLLHSSLSYVEAQGRFAPVGTANAQPFLSWLVYYVHSVRMEVFFLLAGFFGAMVVARRGVQAYLHDRFTRVFLVLLVFLYPLKYLTMSVWMAGFLKTGMWQIPAGLGATPALQLPLVWLRGESWPTIGLVHLWFLYVLSYIAVAAAAAYWIYVRVFPTSKDGSLPPVLRGPDALSRRLAGSVFGPVLLALVVTPLIVRMGGNIETPSTALTVNRTVSALYVIFFAAGWWLHGHRELLDVFARRWRSLTVVGLAASVVGWSLPHSGWPLDPTTTLWVASFARALTATAGVLGLVGAFMSAFRRPSTRIRYIADSSYWIYIAHYPLVMGMQVWLFDWRLPWWIQVPLINVVSSVILFASYHYLVRDRWLGNWLNGRRSPRPQLVRDGAHPEQIPISVNG